MTKKAFLDFRVGHCGGCALEVRFWAQDGAKVTCPNCGLNHEVECDQMLNLTTGKRTEVVMLVPVPREEGNGEHGVSVN